MGSYHTGSDPTLASGDQFRAGLNANADYSVEESTPSIAVRAPTLEIWVEHRQRTSRYQLFEAT